MCRGAKGGPRESRSPSRSQRRAELLELYSLLTRAVPGHRAPMFYRTASCLGARTPSPGLYCPFTGAMQSQVLQGTASLPDLQRRILGADKRSCKARGGAQRVVVECSRHVSTLQTCHSCHSVARNPHRLPHQCCEGAVASSSYDCRRAEPLNPQQTVPGRSCWHLSASTQRSIRSCIFTALQRTLLLPRGLQAAALLAPLREKLRLRLDQSLPLVLALVPATRSGQWRDLTSNHVFLVGFWAWLFAQTLKIFTRRFKTGVWDVRAIADSGGMPSSHSALCTSVTTAVGLEYGLGSPLFAMALCFSLIVMYDATGVRRHAGKQAEVLNIMLGEILEGHPVRATKLKEVLGHTPLQVIAGAMIGVLVGCVFPQPGVMQMSA